MGRLFYLTPPSDGGTEAVTGAATEALRADDGGRLHAADTVVVGAGPGGSSAAAWAARAGRDVVLLDAATFPRDKTCGDGLTPRAMRELQRLGLTDWFADRPRNRGLHTAGFGQELFLPWPGRPRGTLGDFPVFGSAAPRTALDAAIRDTAVRSGARGVSGARAVGVEWRGDRVAAVQVEQGGRVHRLACERLIVADGVRSQLGRHLGREWHRETVYGVAARSYMPSPRADHPWIVSHLELRDETGTVLSGYGWIFPLGRIDGIPTVNIGAGTLATARRPAEMRLRHLLDRYVDARRAEWQLSGAPLGYRSAMLPMGGSVSGVAGPNWMLVGDAAGCVNPLNGEGIDYALETGRLAADHLGLHSYAVAWPGALQHEYGTAFSIARRAAGLLTIPGFLGAAGPVGMRSVPLMQIALRLMGNLVGDQDRDVVARLWRTAGRVSGVLDARPPFAR